MRLLTLLYFISCCCVCISQNKEISYTQFTRQDGLKISEIKALAYDEHGFIWLGGGTNNKRSILVPDSTSVVLQRFNGNSFHSIPAPNIKSGAIADIHKRTDGKFYIVFNRQLYLFDPINTVYTKIYSPENSGISPIFEYKNDTYFISQDNTEVIVNKLHPDLTIEEVFRFTAQSDNFLIDDKTRFIPFGDVVVVSDNNFPITFLNWEGKILKVINPEGFKNDRQQALQKKWIDEDFKKDSTHYVMLYNNSHLYQILPDSYELKAVTVENSKIPNDNIRIHQDPNENNVIVTSYNDKLFAYSLTSPETITSVYTDSKFGATGNIEILSKDLTKELWFTANGVLHNIKFPTKAITTLLPNMEIRAMTSLNSNEHLIATEFDGWFRFNSKTLDIQPYILKENGKIVTLHASRNFFKDKATIWSNDTSGGIVAVDTLTHNIKYYRHYPVLALVEPTDSTIVYGTNGYNLMEFNTNTLTHTPLLPTDSLDTYDLEWHKADNQILASTNKGLLTYNLVTKKHTFYNNPKQLPDSFLTMVDYHPEYGYILGSRSGIITAFDIKTETFTPLYKDELKAGIATIHFENENQWWINTFNGIVSYNPITKETHRFSEKDGLTHNEANRFAFLKTEDGFLVGSLKGLNFFDPDVLRPQVNTAQLLLLSIRSYNTPKKKYTTSYDQYAFAKAETITLPSENRALEVGFGLTEVNAFRNERYRYRLNNQEWVTIGKAQTIRFANLAAGDYTLEIEALDFSGKKMGDSLIIPIHSKNFFYKTWWFFLCITLIISSILFWMFRQQQLRKQLQESFSEDLMQSQEDERARIAKDLHDSVGQQLTLIKQRLQEKGDSDISQLTHNTLEEVRHISRGLYPAILKQLGLSGSIEQLLYDVDEQTDLFVSADIDDIDDFFDEKAALHIYRFVQENVSNVMKHAFAKAISVTIQQEQKTILITIKDNGKGFDVLEKQKNNSLGLKTLQERIRILEGTLTIESNAETGTKTTAQVPYTHAKN